MRNANRIVEGLLTEAEGLESFIQMTTRVVAQLEANALFIQKIARDLKAAETHMHELGKHDYPVPSDVSMKIKTLQDDLRKASVEASNYLNLVTGIVKGMSSKK